MGALRDFLDSGDAGSFTDTSLENVTPGKKSPLCVRTDSSNSSLHVSQQCRLVLHAASTLEELHLTTHELHAALGPIFPTRASASPDCPIYTMHNWGNCKKNKQDVNTESSRRMAVTPMSGQETSTPLEALERRLRLNHISFKELMMLGGSRVLEHNRKRVLTQLSCWIAQGGQRILQWHRWWLSIRFQ